VDNMSTTLRDATQAMTATEAAARLGVSPRTLKRLHATQLPYFTINARGDRRYQAADVDRFIVSRTLGLT
jgi:DNA-binding transcriptional MerR regulator